MNDPFDGYKICFDARGIVTDVDDYDGLAHEDDIELGFEDKFEFEPDMSRLSH